MPGTAIELDYDSSAAVTSPVPLASNWTTVITASGGTSGIKTLDAATITNPSSQIGSLKLPILRINRSRTLYLRMRYDDAAGTTSFINPIVKVFGRTGSGMWQILENLAGEIRAEILRDNDVDLDDGTYRYTHPTNDDNAWDCAGYEEILVGVERAYSTTGGGTDNAAILQARMI